MKYVFDKPSEGTGGASFAITDFQADAKVTTSKKKSEESNLMKFQNNLLELEKRFCDAYARLKINQKHFLL